MSNRLNTLDTDKFIFKQTIKEQAKSIGFDLIGISNPGVPKDYERYKSWLSKGYAGTMDYMSKEPQKRSRVNMPGVKSIISLGLNYFSKDDRKSCEDALISKYARGKDYHIVMSKMLKRLCFYINTKYKDAKLRYVSDTAPILEKAYAQKAGIGWIGKNTCIINKDIGSYVFLGEIITNIDLPVDQTAYNYCSTCRRCIDACPTGALVKPYVLDSRLCISYLTIELKDHINKNLFKHIGNNIFGCDICQDVCPWNTKPTQTNIISLKPKESITKTNLNSFLKLSTDSSFRTLFTQSPIKRAKQKPFLRNAIIVAGNSKNKEYLPTLKNILKLNDSFLTPYVIWAYNKILEKKSR